MTNMENIIRHLEGVDGETMEYVLRRVGMEHQMLRQLLLKADMELVQELVEEKALLEFDPDPDEEVDLFEHPELLPQRMQIVLSKIESDLTYDQCAALLARVERMGYTFDYGLDATPYNLRPLRDE